jgi:hypothetical protein
LKSLEKNGRAGDDAAQQEQCIKTKITMAKQSNNNAEQYARELFARRVSGAPPHPSPASGSQAREAAWGIGVASSLRASKNGKDGSTDHFLLLADRC